MAHVQYKPATETFKAAGWYYHAQGRWWGPSSTKLDAIANARNNAAMLAPYNAAARAKVSAS